MRQKITGKANTPETPELNVDGLDSRIVLRPAELDDAEDYYRILSENLAWISRWMRPAKPPSTVEERRRLMATTLAGGGGGKSHWWMIEVDGELAGTITFHTIELSERWALVGYWLAESYTGRGITTNSLRTIIGWGFAELELVRVEIHSALANRASCSIPERLGIRREAIRRKSEIVNGTPTDMASYAAFSDNWPTKPPEKPLPARRIEVDNELMLRPVEEGDSDAMWHAINSGRDYLEAFLPWVTAIKTDEDHVKNFTSRRFEVDVFDRRGNYAVEYRGEFVGGAGFGLSGSDNNLEIGYWLREDLQGSGIMTRCVTALINMVIVEMGIHRVVIRAASANLPSRGIPERLGFTHEGILRDAALVNGEYLDLELYSMLDHEWLARSGNA